MDIQELREEIYNDVIQDWSELSEVYEGDRLQYIVELIVDDIMTNPEGTHYSNHS